MSVKLRRAKPEDAGAIAHVAALSGLAAIDPDSPRVLKLLAEGRTTVATVNGEVNGFVDCFVTSDQSGGRRFELDLLAVAPRARGRGVGGCLIAASLAAAAEKGALQLRALVRGDNEAMQRLCGRFGFTRSPDHCALYVVDAQAATAGVRNHAARIIAVDTLSYSGLWLEGKLNQSAIDQAHWLASQGAMSVIGAVVSSNALEVASLLEANAFQNLGKYHWWTINRRNARS